MAVSSTVPELDAEADRMGQLIGARITLIAADGRVDGLFVRAVGVGREIAAREDPVLQLQRLAGSGLYRQFMNDLSRHRRRHDFFLLATEGR